MAKLIDLSLNDFNVAGLANYENEFGTKKSDGVGLSTEEITDNDLSVYRRQRAIIASESLDCTSYSVDCDWRFIITASDITVKIPMASYAGCTLKFWADFSGSETTSTITYESSDGVYSDITISAGESVTLRSKVGGGFAATVDSPCPVGFTYTQYPNQALPWELWKFTTENQWENISSQYAGDFFRAEGGNASEFNSGEQDETLPNITGTVGAIIPFKYPNGAFTFDSNSHMLASGSDFGVCIPTLDLSNQCSTYQDGAEVKPKNHTIRIWKRTA